MKKQIVISTLLTCLISIQGYASNPHNPKRPPEKLPVNPLPIVVQPPAATGLIANDLVDVSYQFDQTKVNASADAFHFLRSFVDYFYLVAKTNANNLSTIGKLTGTNGWCVGDAHAENFGVIIKQNNDLIFTHNDIDDSGPAPVIYDLFRLMVSSNLYDTNISLDKMMKYYLAGISNLEVDVPKSIQDMLDKAQKDGTTPSANKIDGNKIIRTPEMIELNNTEINVMKSVVLSLKNSLNSNANLIDAVQTSKVGGGSGGLIRYELLIDNGGNLLHLELKEEVKPSIYPVATSPIPSTKTRVMQSLAIDQGSDISNFYNVFTVYGHDMLLRPRFSGNVGVSLDKQTLSGNEDIIYFECYTLGKIHAQSVKNLNAWYTLLQSIDIKDIKKDVDSMTKFFNQKFKSVKN